MHDRHDRHDRHDGTPVHSIHDEARACMANPGAFFKHSCTVMQPIPRAAKGMPVPSDWVEQVQRFFGVERVERYYGMTEMIALNKMCSAGRYHFQPWVIPILLDPVEGHALPRKGLQRGRAAFFDLLLWAQWGGIITGEEIEVDFSEACSCGQTTVHMSPSIARHGDRNGGGDDKITCAAAPPAHAGAMEYLVGFH